MRLLPALLVGSLCAGLAHVCGAGERCEVETGIKIEKRAEEGGLVRLQFEVRLTSSETCADVGYDVVVDELLPNKQWKSVRLPQRAEVRGRSAVQTVEHAMTRDLGLLRYMVRVVDCHGCPAADTPQTDESTETAETSETP